MWDGRIARRGARAYIGGLPSEEKKIRGEIRECVVEQGAVKMCTCVIEEEMWQKRRREPW
jgi:hypothetical protein